MGPTGRGQGGRVAEVREENQQKQNMCENAIMNPITLDAKLKT